MQADLLKTNDSTWPLLVRLTHWAVATGVLISFFNESGFWHRFIGYACVALVLLRIADGLWFSRSMTSKFYLPKIADIKMHLKELVAGKISHHRGHNPLGQCAVYVMWLVIIFLALTGWLSRTDQFWGEDWPVDVHQVLSYLLQAMVILHLLAVVVVSKLQGRNLIKAMVHGK
ncbi:cytochrome b/b6 domain-containing protein [Methylotenera sp.]|uniref:cytochrome b/b6 domain-containing protein n=1 Tax=Methylotenera sp. TaxID=2051956 RepID=UPI00272035F6|nr:cytochrome b/b6 domain-containing protein [Methylotenera sp.]MDO9203827.1 cytochrome b/b6 domain-containing protein [Methylotenera sp.]MDP2070635.1 cytochrome b/b6 domain-containing protein [Methylotenera sp.]MDP2231281.1 cytochrome b/b6 domain-containing protein [Methylotenera sp.]MDP3004884.1 cytochrome b/b6 domain-containing protein [Methylotenera sp.]MDP3140353.1 cytochrome b/b6 domain-containing protein [Methylotenera sp.]